MTDFTPYLEPQLVEFAPSTTSAPMVLRHGPWYTYTRPATPNELATGKSEITAYDLQMLSEHGGNYQEFHAKEQKRLLKKGLDI